MINISQYLEQQLTDRELQIIYCLADGLSSKQIADKLCISKNTVDTHRRNLLRKRREVGQYVNPANLNYFSK